MQKQFDFTLESRADDVLAPFVGACALEDDDFPFEAISDVAEVESWRKEINRPIYHIHKWWARRLGTVFRAIILGALSPSGSDILKLFYQPTRLNNRVVFDPFMGSGTTIGEAAKLGAQVIGRDINPVAHFLVRNALALHDREKVLRTFSAIEHDVAAQIGSFYKTKLADGTTGTVLYYFWVKQVDCPECSMEVDLFSSRVFAKHARARIHPGAWATCPHCGEVNNVRHDAEKAACDGCNLGFNPQNGPANGQKVICPGCGHAFPIARTIRDKNEPPAHRLYAKLVLTPDGKKVYAAATSEDREAYDNAERMLAIRSSAYPIVAIKPGYNTNQALGYNYRYWHEMFNSRQLLCVSILAERIREVSDISLRELFVCLLSGTLEFNNLFASYKGEGTGAVRHMFAHHILKPERTPIEANVWGTRKSSGSFMTLFEGRIRRALEYAKNPFELRLKDSGAGKRRSEKVYNISDPLGFDIADDFPSFTSGKSVYLSCGDSSDTDIEEGTVDAIITDPPFFDNVHYSQLADFFHVWQRHILGSDNTRLACTTRSTSEVQNADVRIFTERLGAVLAECRRVLSDEGVLAFTYHHSRSEGWISVLHALMKAGFEITATFPVKAEMSVAMPKHQAKEPIDLDIVVVCRKKAGSDWCAGIDDPWSAVRRKAMYQVMRLRDAGRKLSRNDVRVIVMAQLIHRLSRSYTLEEALSLLEASGPKTEALILRLYDTPEEVITGEIS